MEVRLSAPMMTPPLYATAMMEVCQAHFGRSNRVGARGEERARREVAGKRAAAHPEVHRLLEEIEVTLGVRSNRARRVGRWPLLHDPARVEELAIDEPAPVHLHLRQQKGGGKSAVLCVDLFLAGLGKKNTSLPNRKKAVHVGGTWLCGERKKAVHRLTRRSHPPLAAVFNWGADHPTANPAGRAPSRVADGVASAWRRRVGLDPRGGPRAPRRLRCVRAFEPRATYI